MKTLLLVRHAQAGHHDPTLLDRDRPLDDLGRRDAPRMGELLTTRDVRPELMMSSPALRALTTAQILAEELGHDSNAIVVDERLYASSLGELITVIRELDNSLQCVMLVGHNPEFTDLARYFSSEIVDMPTSAIAEFSFHTTVWSDVGRVEPVRASLDHPRKSPK